MSMKVQGVSRVADNEKALLVSFTRRPTDDEIRTLHDLLRELRISKLIPVKSAAEKHNEMLVDRIKGVPAQAATEESDSDPHNPNTHQSDA